MDKESVQGITEIMIFTTAFLGVMQIWGTRT
jgi:hypothetical protein